MAMLPKDLVAQFKEKCKETGVSQAQVVKKAIETFLSE
ncbi:MAG: CopG family transcriptional regulator [Ruminococcaceae bacterium]|nr:CopG family transcriptional regulator [Oscillospiraceae bacterium]